MSAPIVILLRRDPGTLTEIEKTALQLKFGKDIKFIRTDPADYRQHRADCERLMAVAVLLPKERPIPATAMEEGFVHVVVFDDGTVQKLLPLEPEFQPL